MTAAAAPPRELDLDFVRSHFPAFAEPTLEGWGFFENAGGSYPCRQTVDALSGFYQRTKVQPFHPFPASAAAGAAMDRARQRWAAALGVGADEVHFGPSTTQNTYVLANAVRRAGFPAGSEVIVTNQDHEANSGPWRRLDEAGFVVREWRIDSETGRLAVGAPVGSARGGRALRHQ